MLEELTGKKYVTLLPRCNRGILLVLRWAKDQGYEDLYFPDQGGWITYEQYGRKLKFKLHKLMTKRGMIHFNRVKENSVVIFHDMPAYATFQNDVDMKEMKEKNILVINDITGSVGVRKPKGDIIVCSFGKTKIINVGYGGCIASDIDLGIEEEFNHKYDEQLREKVDKYKERLDFLYQKKREILSQLKEYEIIYPEGEGVNILVKGHDVEKLCKEKGWPYKKCPMDIKLNEKAISIEVQQFQ